MKDAETMNVPKNTICGRIITFSSKEIDMSKKASLNKNIDELSIKDNLVTDTSKIKIRNSVTVDPASMLFIPIIPIVVGKKQLKMQKDFNCNKKSIERNYIVYGGDM